MSLVSKRRGRKRIKILDHQHAAIVPRSVKVVGWIQSPFAGRIAVVLGYLAQAEEGPPLVEVEVVGAPLRW